MGIVKFDLRSPEDVGSRDTQRKVRVWMTRRVENSETHSNRDRKVDVVWVV
jgi:hypothetical protein